MRNGTEKNSFVHTKGQKNSAPIGARLSTAKDQSLPRWLLIFIALSIILFATGLIRSPVEFLLSFSSWLSFLFITYCALRMGSCVYSPFPSSPLRPLSSELPLISVLLPVYKEAHMIESLAQHVGQIDYPESRLDKVIICEPDDKDTIAAAQEVTPQNFRVFVTNGTGPRTKPNALNAALPHCRCDIITVYDAEDRPHPQQLRAAAHALSGNPALAVVQAPLMYYNADQNWLTRQFALEYAALFLVWLPFLKRLNLPFPLGGTSNHIRGLM